MRYSLPRSRELCRESFVARCSTTEYFILSLLLIPVIYLLPNPLTWTLITSVSAPSLVRSSRITRRLSHDSRATSTTTLLSFFPSPPLSSIYCHRLPPPCAPSAKRLSPLLLPTTPSPPLAFPPPLEICASPSVPPHPGTTITTNIPPPRSELSKRDTLHTRVR